jgi:hypothetical protein
VSGRRHCADQETLIEEEGSVRLTSSLR